MYSYAMIGFGGLGKLHLTNLDKIAKKRGDFYLKAICSTTAEAFKQSVNLNLGTVDVSAIDIEKCSFYDDYKELIDKERPDFIISALPTYMHEEAAVYALSRGVHVFSEKPMALSLEACRRMMAAAEAHNKKLMIGQCLRFSPLYVQLKSYIDSGCFGKAYRAEFKRYSKMPRWTWNNWILDPEKSGGCVLDLHIHDVDLINWFFGTPKSLYATVTERKAELESIFTQYTYEDGLAVTASADWSMPETFPFDARCLVNFEEATVVIADGKMTVYTEEEVITPEIPDTSDFENEMEAFLKLVIDDEACEVSQLTSIYDSMKIAMKEIESAKTAATVRVDI